MNKDAPKFSIVVPAYNAARFIVDALESVRRQSFGHYEILVVDDGSTDETASVVTDWQTRNSERRLTLITKSNGGPSSARNAAVHIAKAPFVALLDADDWWHDEKLQEVRDYLNRCPKVDVIAHDYYFVSSGRLGRLVSCGPFTTYRQHLYGLNPIGASTAVVRRSKLNEAGGFSEDRCWHGCEDADLWLKLARSHCSFGYIHKPLGYYRVHAGGLSKAHEQHCANVLSLVRAHFASLDSRSVWDHMLFRRKLGLVYRGALLGLLSTGNRLAAMRCALMSLKCNPLGIKTWVLLAASFLPRRCWSAIR